MTEVYKSLKKANFEWKSLTPYRVKCRYPVGLIERGRRVPTSEVVKVTIYCYKTPRGVYILDFQKTYGQTFLFLELCGKLIIDLKRLPVVQAQDAPVEFKAEDEEPDGN